MNKILFPLALVLMYAAAAFAQKQTYDAVSYTIPPGWQHDIKENNVQLYSLDKNTGEFVFALIFKSVATNASAAENFTAAWNKLVKAQVNVEGPPTMLAPSAEKGWDIVSGHANYSSGNNKGLVTLVTATGNRETASLVFMSNSAGKQQELTAFLNSIELTRTAKSETKTTAAAPPAGRGRTIEYDVWQSQAANASTLQLEFKTVVLSPDGKCLYYIPEQGLNGVTPEANTEFSWGTVTDEGNKLALRNAKSGNMDLYKMSPTTMGRYPEAKTNLYKKVKPVNGLRFEGAYSPELSYYNGKTNLLSRQTDPNKRPILFFKADGTYVNEGIAFSNITRGDDFAIGKGTYEIIHYSLLLTTQSGRTLQVAFTPVSDADPTRADNGGFIINNNLFRRLDKTFVPRN